MGQFKHTIELKIFQVTLQFSLNHLSGHSVQDLRAKGKFFFTGSLRDKLEPHYPVKQLQWNFSGDVSFQNEHVKVLLAPQSTVKTALLPINDFHIPQADLTFMNPLTGMFELHTQKWKADSFILRINTPQVRWQDQTLNIQQIKLTMNQLTGSFASLETAGQVVLLGIMTKINEFIPPTTNWKAQFSATSQSIQGNLLGQTKDTHVSIYGKFHQHFLTKEGRFQIKLPPVALSPSSFNLHEAIKPWPYPTSNDFGEPIGIRQCCVEAATDT